MSRATLDGFCRLLVDGGAPGVRLHPTAIAREFVDFFGLSAFPRMDEIETRLKGAGVATVVYSSDTRGLRGYHTGTRSGGYEIVIDESESNATQEHTALHEAYEIVRERLCDLYPHVRSPPGQEASAGRPTGSPHPP